MSLSNRTKDYLLNGLADKQAFNEISSALDEVSTAVKASKVIGDLTFESKFAGLKGNSISVELIDGGIAGSEEVLVVNKKVSIIMEDGVSSADEIKTALDSSVAFLAIASVIVSGTGSDAQNSAVEVNLEGGLDHSLLSNFSKKILKVALASNSLIFLEIVDAFQSRSCQLSSKAKKYLKVMLHDNKSYKEVLDSFSI